MSKKKVEENKELINWENSLVVGPLAMKVEIKGENSFQGFGVKRITKKGPPCLRASFHFQNFPGEGASASSYLYYDPSDLEYDSEKDFNVFVESVERIIQQLESFKDELWYQRDALDEQCQQMKKKKSGK
jgi:hypothetical protein